MKKALHSSLHGANFQRPVWCTYFQPTVSVAQLVKWRDAILIGWFLTIVDKNHTTLLY
ncbi:MAG: hypothetical protein ACFFB3_11535 [Candidatus Hodarchaeota archaeon]